MVLVLMATFHQSCSSASDPSPAALLNTGDMRSEAEGVYWGKARAEGPGPPDRAATTTSQPRHQHCWQKVSPHSCLLQCCTSYLLPFLWQKPHSLYLISVLEVPPLCSWHENPWIGHCLVSLPSPDPDHVSVEPAFKEPYEFCVVLHEPCGGLFWQGCDDVNKGWSAFLVYSVIRITIIVSLTLTYFVKEWIYGWPTVTRGRGQSAEMFSLDCFNKQGYPCFIVCPDTFHTSYLQWRWGSNFYLCKLIIHKNLIATWCA